MRPPDVAIGIVDVHDAPVQGLVSDQAAGGLNLGKLWHPPVLPARGSGKRQSSDQRPASQPGGVTALWRVRACQPTALAGARRTRYPAADRAPVGLVLLAEPGA